MKCATFIRLLDGFTGEAKLYRVEPPVAYDEPWEADGPPARHTNYVIVSATVAMFSGPETYIFPASEGGEILDWGELNGSFKGGMDHEEALRGAGYEID